METFWAKYGNVGNDLAHRVEVLSGACGASFRSESSREVRIGHKCTFLQSFRNFRKMGDAKKNVSNAERTFSERMELVRGQSVAWRARYVRKRPGPPRKVRVVPIRVAGYPIFDLARFGLQGPRVCPAQRGMMALGDTRTLVHPGALRYLD